MNHVTCLYFLIFFVTSFLQVTEILATEATVYNDCAIIQDDCGMSYRIRGDLDATTIEPSSPMFIAQTSTANNGERFISSSIDDVAVNPPLHSTATTQQTPLPNTDQVVTTNTATTPSPDAPPATQRKDDDNDMQDGDLIIPATAVTM